MPKKEPHKKVVAKKPESKKQPAASSGDSKTYAFIATFLTIIGFVIALLAWKKDKYVMFYAKQSLVLFVVAIIVWIINAIFVFIPVLGKIIAVILNILIFILWLLSWIYALSGEQKDVPLIGNYARKINI